MVEGSGFWLEPNRLVKVLDGIFQIAFREPGATTTVVHLGSRRIEPDRFAVVFDGFVEVFLGVPYACAPAVCVCQFRIELNGFGKVLDCRVELPLARLCLARPK